MYFNHVLDVVGCGYRLAVDLPTHTGPSPGQERMCVVKW